MAEKRACSVCGSLHSMDELTVFDDSYLCETCLHAETTRCQRCGKRIWVDDNAGDGITPLCQGCYNRFYTTCEDCGRVILHDDACYESDDDYEARCYSCHCRHADQRVIHDQYYKPESFGEGQRFYGVELEVDDGGEINSNAPR